MPVVTTKPGVGCCSLDWACRQTVEVTGADPGRGRERHPRAWDTASRLRPNDAALTTIGPSAAGQFLTLALQVQS